MSCCYIDLYDLKVGDICMEDTYPETYKVIGYGFDRDLGGKVVILENIETKERDSFGYTCSAYAPCMVLIKRGK